MNSEKDTRSSRNVFQRRERVEGRCLIVVASGKPKERQETDEGLRPEVKALAFFGVTFIRQ